MFLHEVLTIGQEHFLLFLQTVPILMKNISSKYFIKIIYNTELFLSNKHNLFLLIDEEYPIDRIIVEHFLDQIENLPKVTEKKKLIYIISVIRSIIKFL